MSCNQSFTLTCLEVGLCNSHAFTFNLTTHAPSHCILLLSYSMHHKPKQACTKAREKEREIHEVPQREELASKANAAPSRLVGLTVLVVNTATRNVARHVTVFTVQCRQVCLPLVDLTNRKTNVSSTGGSGRESKGGCSQCCFFSFRECESIRNEKNKTNCFKHRPPCLRFT